MCVQHIAHKWRASVRKWISTSRPAGPQWKTHMLTWDIHVLSLHNNQKTQEKGAECSQSAKLSFKSVCNCQHASEILRSFTLTLKINTPQGYWGKYSANLPSAPSAQSPTCNSSSRPKEILQPCRSQEIHLTTCFWHVLTSCGAEIMPWQTKRGSNEKWIYSSRVRQIWGTRMLLWIHSKCRSSAKVSRFEVSE